MKYLLHYKRKHMLSKADGIWTAYYSKSILKHYNMNIYLRSKVLKHLLKDNNIYTVKINNLRQFGCARNIRFTSKPKCITIKVGEK